MALSRRQCVEHRFESPQVGLSGRYQDIYVSGIFSDTLYETYDNTDEFIEWVLAKYLRTNY